MGDDAQAGSDAAASARRKAEDEAIGLWLARRAHAPEAWRSRASSASGLLSTAAAAVLLSLLLAPDRVSSLTRVGRCALVIAVVGYVVAVLSYLIASVIGYPKDRDDDVDGFATASSDYFAAESKPIRGFVYVGTGAAILAILGTAVTVGDIAQADRPSFRGMVSLTPDAEEDVQNFCPDFSSESIVEIEERDSQVVLQISAKNCGDGAAILRLDASSIIVARER